jgi:hypothetical protein
VTEQVGLRTGTAHENSRRHWTRGQQKGATPVCCVQWRLVPVRVGCARRMVEGSAVAGKCELSWTRRESLDLLPRI